LKVCRLESVSFALNREQTTFALQHPSLDPMTLPSDPLFRLQWYIYNTGQGGRIPGLDLNLIDEDGNNFDVWDEYSGSGIKVGVIDDGISANHPDLKDNVNTLASQIPGYNYEANGKPITRDDTHGTSVAGIIAAAQNTIGTIGVAYNAKLTSFNYLSPTSVMTGPKALRNQAFFDVSNNSWGPRLPFGDNPRYSGDNRRKLKGLQTAAVSGRNGLGTVMAFAAGNGFDQGMDADFFALNSSRFGMAIGAVNGKGKSADYSSIGPCLLVSAFAEGGEDSRGNDGYNIVTTDRVGKQGNNPNLPSDKILPDTDYTSSFDGTSAATPQVSGVAALMLEANPNLGYRDVQEILAYSAVQTDTADEGWRFNGAKNWNGGGLHQSDLYGYGVVDAHAAVRLAESWTLQSTAANEASLTASKSLKKGGIAISDRQKKKVQQITLPMASGLLVNHAELDIQIKHTAIEDLAIALVSPAGTGSFVFAGGQLTKKGAKLSVSDRRISFTKLRNRPELAGDRSTFRLAKFYQKGLDYKFTTTFNWGETSGGDWKVEVVDLGKLGTGKVISARINLYGDSVTTADTYIYTEEFAKFTGADTASRRILTDTNEGIDTLNAAALRSDSTINLEPGQFSTLAGNRLQISSETVIENAIAGDGKDTVIGNLVDNELRGGRNTDTLIGGGGNDLLFGGKQADTLIGCGAERGINTIDRLSGGEGGDLFVLGDSLGVFYALGAGAGLADYAVITDFSSEVDRVQLSGQPDQYSLGASPIANETGAAIYRSSNLVAVLRGVNAANLSLTAGYFSYV
jgi:subtilisin-like proprotein convertase family protein